MNLRNLLVAGVVLLCLALSAGCQSASSGGGGSSGPPPVDEDNINGDGDQNAQEGNDPSEGSTDGNSNSAAEDETDDNQNTNDNSEGTQDPEEEPELTDEQTETVNATVAMIQNLADVFAALGAAGLPTADDLPIVINPNPTSECPTITLDLGLLIIEYGEGCIPLMDPESTYSGTITGQANLVDRTITLTFDDFAIDSDTVNGTVVASVSQEGDLLILDATVDLELTGSDYEGTVTGHMIVQVNLATGEVVIPEADLSSTDQSNDTYAVILDDVHIIPIEVFPHQGTATLVLGTEGPGALTIEITFTEDTPTDGTVWVSVNGSTPVRMSLEDVEVEP